MSIMWSGMDETAEQVLLECVALTCNRLESMGLSGSELENIRNIPGGVVRRFIDGMHVM